MRRRIWRISEDRFEDQKPDLQAFPESVSCELNTEGSHSGEFLLKSRNHIPARGIIYSSNPYVRCLVPQFDGTEVKVSYDLPDTSYSEQDIVEGFFGVVYNMGELKIPYRFTFHKASEIQDSAWKDVKAPEDLTRLAQTDREGALHLFFSSGYETMMLQAPLQEQILYRGYRAGTPTQQNLENFLSAAGWKKPVYFRASEKQQNFPGISADEQGSVELIRNTWGFLKIRVTSDADFLTPEQESISDEDFLGTNLTFHFMIHYDSLHGGRNLGHLHFSDGRTDLSIPIEAVPERTKSWEETERKLSRQRALVQMYRDYIAFRLGHMEKEDWISRVLKSCDSISAMEKEETEEKEGFLSFEESPWFNIIRCYAHILNDDRQEALYMIRELREDLTVHTGSEWAALLYLCILIEPEDDYKERLTAEIEKIFRIHGEDLRIFLILLQLRTEYEEDPALKLKAIRQWVMNGYNSPMLYLEVRDLYEQNPFLLNEINDFSYRVLSFLRQNHGFTSVTAMQMVEIMTFYPVFDHRILNLLVACYKEAYEKDDLLKRILLYLLLGKQFRKEYLSWYLLGIEKGMNISGLYEAYLYSLPEDSIEPLPKSVKIYFRYPNQLPFDRKALLFANCIARKHEDPETYHDYFPEIEKFAEEQMKVGRISDNLTVIYRDVLERGLLTDEGYQSLNRLFFVKKAVVLRQSARRLVLIENCMKEPRMVPVADQVSYIPVIDQNYRIFLEDADGSVYADPDICGLEDLFDHKKYEIRLRNQAKDDFVFALSDFTHRNPMAFQDGDVAFTKQLLESDSIRREWLIALLPDMMEFLKKKGREEILSSCLWENREHLIANTDLRKDMFSYGIRQGEPEEVYDTLQRQYALQVRPDLLLRIVNYMIVQKEFQSDDFLISLAAWLFQRDICSEQTVSYLNRYFSGTVDQMLRLFRHTEQDRMDDTELASRTLIQMLYCDRHESYPEQLYQAFLRRKPNRMVAEAFLTYWSRQYILDILRPGDSLFRDLLRMERTEDNPNDSCRIALLKYLCGKETLEKDEYQAMDGLFHYFIPRNVYFPFYSQADSRLRIRYHLYDKTFIEYRGQPGDTVILVLQRSNGTEETGQMKEMYDGIYISSIVLFFGETVDYRIYLGDTAKEPEKNGHIAGEETVSEQGESRFYSINRMQSDVLYGNTEQLKEEMQKYDRQDHLTRNLFHWI